MSEALHRATLTVTEVDLPHMVLGPRDLPAVFRAFIPKPGEFLDNVTMAENGMPGSDPERFRAIGRLTGYVQQFRAPRPEGDTIPAGYDLEAATVVHLFDDADGVCRWINEVFVHDFEANIDHEIHPGQRLLLVERLDIKGFTDISAGLHVLHSTPDGPVAATVVDFRVGRVLGVTYITTLGNYARQELVTELGLALERKIVHVVLGGV